LYACLLESAGYRVKAFNDRSKALTTLRAETNKPRLLITDYFGGPMPIETFIRACRFVQPSLRILMASGFEQGQMRFSHTRPDHYIQKPFTAEEFQKAVRTTLA
jgi:DNA-binding response OmpR family regulator